jgi:putative transposase
LLDRIDALRTAFSDVKFKRPFTIDAIVILPDHLHCIWTLPEGDSDFSTRGGLIKAHFSRQIAKGERICKSREKRGERGLWQRRFWEHLIRDETDYRLHVDYILESGQTWLGTMRQRLAAFKFSSIRGLRRLY